MKGSKKIHRKSAMKKCMFSLLLAPVLFTQAATLTLRQKGDNSTQLAVKTARIPFCTFNISADRTHLIDSFQISKAGTAPRRVIDQIVILDESGTVIGSGVMGTDNLAYIDVGLVLIPGKSSSLTIAGDMIADLSAEAGTSISLVLTGIIHDVSVINTDIVWPISATHIVNYSLTIGQLRVSSSQQVLDQNITKGVQAQLLGGFRLETGSIEDVEIGALFFNVNEYGPNGHLINDITNIELVDARGTIVAGPVDIVGSLITFSDPFVVPKGGGDFFLKGKVGFSYATGTKFVISTRPKTWRNVRGQVYGFELIPHSSYATVISATMTVVGHRRHGDR